MKVVVATPSLAGVTEPYKQALAASAPILEQAGLETSFVQELGNPYISAARATMLRKALDGQADVVAFIDYDLSWRPDDLLKLIETEGEVVAGTYRFKKDDTEFMGGWNTDATGRPVLRDDGCINATRVPAGFLKVTKEGVDKFMRAYPELIYGSAYSPSIDLFNHGAIDHVWYGEDYAFSKRWTEKCGEIWLVPDLELTHHSDDKAYPGNLHEWLMRQPGGAKEGQPWP
jgi:glycosyltransferase involved in cell wall biosynthesis